MSKTKNKKSLGIKSNDKISRSDIKKTDTTHIKFNFAFITTNNKYNFESKEFNKNHKAQLSQRMYELSRVDFLTLLGTYSKESGIELIEIKNTPGIGSEFDKTEFRRGANSKFAVFRLYTNNNPIAARIIGKLVDKIFYIFYIDLTHNIYPG